MKTIICTLLGILAVSIPAPAQPSSRAAAAEVQAYIQKAQRGEAGVNPRDQTAARSGDPYAQARVRQRLANNRITEQFNQGSISAEHAAYLRQQQESARQAESQRIELERIRWEIERQNRELERIRIDAESRRAYRR